MTEAWGHLGPSKHRHILRSFIRAVSLYEDVRKNQGDSDCRRHKVGPKAARPICPIHLYVSRPTSQAEL